MFHKSIQVNTMFAVLLTVLLRGFMNLVLWGYMCRSDGSDKALLPGVHM